MPYNYDNEDEIQGQVDAEMPPIDRFQSLLDEKRRMQQNKMRDEQEASIGQEIEAMEPDLLPQMPEPVIPEASRMPASETSPVKSISDYQKLLDTRQEQQRNLTISKALQQMGQSFVGGQTGNFKTDTTVLDELAKQTNLPVEGYESKQKVDKADIGLGDERQMRDSKSKISQFYRGMAKKRGLEVTDDMSAFDVAAMIKLKDGAGSGKGIMKDQQAQYLNKETGNPLIFKLDAGGQGTYVDAVTGEKPNGMVRNVLVADAMGTKFYSPGPGQAPIKAIGSEYAQTKPELLEENYKKITESGDEFKPSKDQREAMSEEKKRLDKLLEGSKSQIASANSVLGVLDGDSKLALSVVKSRMPRVMGEVGNLNQQEQEMWQGSQAWLDRAEQYLSKISTSELTPQNKSELKQILAPFVQSAKASADFAMDSSSKSLSGYGIPASYAKKQYGGIYLPPAVEKAVAKKVKVKNLETGQVGQIPEANLEKAIASKKFELVK